MLNNTYLCTVKSGRRSPDRTKCTVLGQFGRGLFLSFLLIATDNNLNIKE